MSIKLLPQILSSLLSSITDRKKGMDSEEIIHITDRLSSIDCGDSAADLKAAVEQFERLDQQKKIEIAEAFIDTKLYEEDVCRMYHTNRTTLMRWQAKGKLPKWRHEPGGKNYLFFDECTSSVRSWDDQHS